MEQTNTYSPPNAARWGLQGEQSKNFNYLLLLSYLLPAKPLIELPMLHGSYRSCGLSFDLADLLLGVVSQDLLLRVQKDCRCLSVS